MINGIAVSSPHFRACRVTLAGHLCLYSLTVAITLLYNPCRTFLLDTNILVSAGIPLIGSVQPVAQLRRMIFCSVNPSTFRAPTSSWLIICLQVWINITQQKSKTYSNLFYCCNVHGLLFASATRWHFPSTSSILLH